MNQGYQVPTSNIQGYQVPSGSTQSAYGYYVPNYNMVSNNNGDERLAGGFVFPFLLGGVTGAALAPNFWRPNRPVYYPYPPGPYPYPPRRWL